MRTENKRPGVVTARKRILAVIAVVAMLLASIPFGSLSAVDLSEHVSYDSHSESLFIKGALTAEDLIFIQSYRNRAHHIALQSVEYADCTGLFSMFTSVEEIIIDGLKTDKAAEMFSSCIFLEEISIYHWDTSRITDMHGMFQNCVALKTVNVEAFDVSNVKDMRSMFSCCMALTGLNVGAWNVSNVTDMEAMFLNCFKLADLDVSAWDVSNVTEMRMMFSGCSALKKLALDAWDPACVTDDTYMFDGCTSLADRYSLCTVTHRTPTQILDQTKRFIKVGETFTATLRSFEGYVPDPDQEESVTIKAEEVVGPIETYVPMGYNARQLLTELYKGSEQNHIVFLYYRTHEFRFSPTSDGAGITATCAHEEECPYAADPLTLKLVCTENTGLFIEPKKVALAGLDEFNRVTGLGLSPTVNYYRVDQNGETLLKAAPAFTGSFRAETTLTINGVDYPLSLSYTIDGSSDDNATIIYKGSILSDRNLAIVTGVVGIAFGMAIMYLIMRKKAHTSKN